MAGLSFLIVGFEILGNNQQCRNNIWEYFNAVYKYKSNDSKESN